MTEARVSTKEELEKAKNAKVDVIVVEGQLANKIKKSKKIVDAGTAGSAAIAVLLAATAATPFTGGMSFLAAAPLAAMTGFEISAIILAASIGLTLLIAIFKDYEEIECSNGRLMLKRKVSKAN